jgi:uncharacterized repeat protein (TIGR02543 family)
MKKFSAVPFRTTVNNGVLYFILALILSFSGWGQVNMANTNSHTQNFNGLATSGSSNAWTNNSTIGSWYSQRTGTGTTYQADAGSGNGGGLYSYGAASNTDRALGTIGSSNASAGDFAHGVLLKNTSGATLTDIKVSYTLEQWRNGGNTTAQAITFWYKTSSSAISALNPNSNAGWTPVTALTLNSPINTSTAGALDGNAVSNRVSVANVAIPGLSLANNNFIMLKWEDPDHTGTDHGLSIDDVTINWTVPTAPTNINITYNTQGGSTITNGTTTVGGSLTASPGTPTKTGYSFLGWFTSSTGGTAITFPYTHNQSADFTLYAQWSPNTLSVTYNTQGGSSIPNGATVTGGNISSSPNTPTNAGFTFLGWFTAPSGGAAITFPYAHGQTADFTLYAQWIAANSPSLQQSLSSLSGFSVIYNNGSSTSNSISISGDYLTGAPGSISIGGLTNFEVSTDNISFSATASVAFATASLGSTNLYFRLKSGLSVASYSETATISGGGAAGLSLTLTGQVTKATPVVQNIPTASAITYLQSLSSSSLSGGTANVAGNFAFENSSLIPSAAGTYTATVIFTPTDALNYSTVATSVVLDINKANQTLSGLASTDTKTTAAPSYTLGATASSGLSVQYTSSNTSVATISGSTVTIVGPGVTTISASQSGNVNYNPAASINQTLTVTLAPLVLAGWDFNSIASSSTINTFTSTTFNTNLIAANGSNNITRGSGAPWSNAGSSFRTTGFQNNGISVTNTDYFQITLQPVVGKLISLSSINANASGTATFCASPGVSSQFAYSLDGINFTLIGTPVVTIGTPASLPTIDLSNIAQLQNVPAGTIITIRYYASGQTSTGGWGFYSSAAGVNGLAVSGFVNSALTPPTLNADVTSNTVDNNIDITFADNLAWRNAITSVKVGAVSLNSGNDYIISSGQLQLLPSGLNSVLTTSGTKTITVSSLGYTDATITQIIQAGIPTQNSTSTINSTLSPNNSATITCIAKDQYNNLVSGYFFKYDVSITSNNSQIVESYTIDGATLSASANNLEVVSPTNSLGSTTFTISLPSVVNEYDGLNVQVQLTDGMTNVGNSYSYYELQAQTITFASIAAVTYGDAGFSLTAAGGASGNPVVFTSSNPNVVTCTGLNGSTITIVGAGSANIIANQAGNANFNPAAPVSQVIQVNQKQLTIYGIGAADKVYNGSSSATIIGTPQYVGLVNNETFAVSGNPIATFSNADAGVNKLVSFTGYNAPSLNYSLVQPTATATISQATQLINFAYLPNRVLGGANFTLNATASSGLPISYQSSNASVATISGNTVTIVGSGTTSIIASQAGANNFEAAASVSQDLTILTPIAGWDFFGAQSPNSFSATTLDAHLDQSISAITRGPNAQPNSVTNAFSTLGFQNDGISTSNLDYFQVTLKAEAGYLLSLSAINANFNGTNSFFAAPGVTSQYAYSLDDSTFTLIGSPITSTSLKPLPVNLQGIAELQNVPSTTTVTLRYYASGQTSTGGWRFASPSSGVLGLAIDGAVNVACPNVTVSTSNASICLGSSVTLTASGASSYNWIGASSNSESVVVSPSATTTYSVEGTQNGCTVSQSITINVDQPVAPLFDQVAAICAGTTLSALPTTSTNGIGGTWSPSLDNTTTSTYTFTPVVGTCASTATMTIVVNQLTVPLFNQVASICPGSPLAALPTTSTNGIAGTWSPASMNNTATTTYTFTPDSGCNASTTMTIGVITAPVLSTNANIICAGIPVVLTPSVSTGLTWQRQAVGTTTWSAVTNTLPTLTISAASATTTGAYRVSSSQCPGLWSNSVAVAAGVVTPTPTMSLTSPSLTTCVGGSVSFAANTTVSNPSYQWFKATAAIPGATTASYTVDATATTLAGAYNVKVTETGKCPSLASASQTVVVNALPATPIVTVAVAGTTPLVCGSTGVVIKSSVAPAATAQLQWFLNGAAIVGATAQNYTATAVGTYTVQVTNPVTLCSGAMSAGFIIQQGVVPATPVMSITSGSAVLCGTATVTLSSDVAASSTTTLKWYKGTTLIPTATGTSYTITGGTTAAGSYSVVASAVGGCVGGTSNAIAVTYFALPATPVVSLVGSTYPVLCGTTGVTLKSSIAPTASTVTPVVATLQWYKDGQAIAGATAQNYVATQAGSYQVQVTNPTTGCTGLMSAATVVSVGVVPSAPVATASGATLLCGTAAQVTLSSSVAASGTATTPGSITLQWYKSVTNATTGVTTVTTIPAAAFGTNQAILLAGSALSGVTYSGTAVPGSYTVKALLVGGCPSAASNAISASFSALPAVSNVTTTTAGASTLLCGSPISLKSSLAASATVLVQWYKDGQLISGATGTNYIASEAGSYTVVTSNVAGCSAAAGTALVLTQGVAATTPVITANGSTAICGLATAAVQLTSSVAAQAGTTTLQWYKNGTAVTGGTATTLSVLNTAANAGSYTVKVLSQAGACPSALSAATSITTGTAPTTVPTVSTVTSTGAASAVTVLSNTTQTIYLKSSVAPVTATATVAPVILKWYKNGVEMTSTVNTGLSNQTIAVTSAGSYTVRAFYGTSMCEGIMSVAKVITGTSPLSIVNNNQAHEDNTSKLNEELVWDAAVSRNPFEQYVTIRLNSASESEVELTMIDAMGKVVSHEVANLKELGSMRLGEGLTPGMYMINIRQDENIKTIRVIKQ